MPAVLFDIDGTLLRAGGVGRRALAEAFAEVAPRPLEEVRVCVEAMDFRGRTDALLFEELGAAIGHPHLGLAATMEPYLARLEAALQDNVVETLPGVRNLLEILERSTTVVGLLTGNVREGARRKLRRIGLEHLVERPGGFGDDGRHRTDLADTALTRLRAEGVEGPVVVVGDTEHDVLAGQHIGARTVAVATGWTPVETLHSSGADLVLPDLQNIEALTALLVG